MTDSKRTVAGVGYIGEGIYKCSIDGRKTKAYESWRGMLRRCYDVSQRDKYPTYADCTVCDEWLNFQVFAEWYVNHPFGKKGYQLDKDILMGDSKIYSPETCCLIPQDINKLLNKYSNGRGVYPQGVDFNKSTGKFRARIRVNGRHKSLGYYENMNDAHSAYKSAKEQHVKVVAAKNVERIERSVFNALMNWGI